MDVVTALYATVAVLAALYARRELGRGQRITIDLLHANLAMLANQWTGWLASGRVPQALGNVHPSIEPFATYRAGDGDLMIGAGNDSQFSRLAAAIGVPELASNRVSTRTNGVSRTATSCAPPLEARLETRTRAEWRDVLLDAGVPAGPVQTIDEAFSLAEALGLDAVDETDARAPSASRRTCRIRLRKCVGARLTWTSTQLISDDADSGAADGERSRRPAEAATRTGSPRPRARSRLRGPRRTALDLGAHGDVRTDDLVALAGDLVHHDHALAPRGAWGGRRSLARARCRATS